MLLLSSLDQDFRRLSNILSRLLLRGLESFVDPLSGTMVDDRDKGPPLPCAGGAVLMGVNEPDLVALTFAEFGYLEDDKPASTDFGIDLTL
jgi:hypothetical protein